MPGGHPLTLPDESSSERGILITVVLGTMLVPLNSTMIAVALPRVISDLHSTLSSAGWLVTGYLIAMASLQPAAGRLGDRLGRRPLILGGLAWFGVASLAAALAPDVQLLIVDARVLGQVPLGQGPHHAARTRAGDPQPNLVADRQRAAGPVVLDESRVARAASFGENTHLPCEAIETSAATGSLSLRGNV